MPSVFDYYFHLSLFLRTPVKDYNYFQRANMVQISRDPYFQSALFLASKSLYRELENRGFDYNSLNPGEKNSLRKYFNRMCFRPTPFGLFSGFSVAGWGNSNCPLVIKDQLKVHRYLSYKQSLAFTHELVKRYIPSLAYSANRTLYRVHNEYRYLRYEQDPEEDKRRFFIDSFEKSESIETILHCCIKEQNKEALLKLISGQLPFSQEEIEAFLDRLIEKQIIIPAIQPNITGEDYLSRILDLCDRAGIKEWCSEISLLEKFSSRKLSPEAFESPIYLEKIIGDGRLETLSEPRRSSSLYVNLEKPNTTGNLDMGYQKKILDGLYCLNRLLPVQEPLGLQKFAAAFKVKYDRQAVPLLEALDPEIGIGYESLAGEYSSSVLLKNVTINYPAKDIMPLEWTTVHALLMEKWKASEGVICLTQEEIDQLSNISADYSLPPSISVLFRIWGDLIYIEQAGGATATSMLGRFTFFSDEVLAICRETAAKEEEANPHVIFTEIAHLCNMHSANIEQRKLIRQYEIPVLTGSGMDSQHQIPLSDLVLTISADRIMLWSRKHQKQVIPRLTSAFNYKRSELAVFRFLCDLQYQSLKANLSFDLSLFFPGLTYYPRVQYKSAILQLATWHIGQEELRQIVWKKSSCEAIADLRKFAVKMNWPRYISLNKHDHQLVFDMENVEDVHFLSDTLKSEQQEALIKEFPFVNEEVPIVIDQHKRPYINQFVASLYHENQVYKVSAHPFPAEITNNDHRRRFISGSDWLYIKLYCHPSRSNELLVNCILPTVELLTGSKQLKKWFFIRYSDPGYHLRIRFQVNPSNTNQIIAVLNRKINPLAQAGIISSFQFDTYERELERYSPTLIEDIENVFCKSSALVVNYLKGYAVNEADYEFYSLGFSGIDYVLNIFDESPEKKAHLLRMLYESFYREFQGSKKLNEQLKRKFRELRNRDFFTIKPLKTFFSTPGLRSLLREFHDSLTIVESKVKNWEEGRKQQLISDLIHMQLNRLLTDAHRKQELIIYYCLWKQYASVAARMKLGQAFTS